jgi:hypothetical protein
MRYTINCLKHCLKKYQIDFKMYVDYILYTNSTDYYVFLMSCQFDATISEWKKGLF